MNKPLAALATQRTADGVGPQAPGYCQMWLRLTVQQLYGDHWDRWIWKTSARLAGNAFWNARNDLRSGGVTVLRTTRVAETQLGDVLYRTLSGGAFGHVSIRVAGNLAAENSSVHQGVHGAVGFRPLSQVVFDTIVRLPDPVADQPPVTVMALLRELYAEAADQPGMLRALNALRHHPEVAALVG